MDDSRLDRIEHRMDELDQRAGAMERTMDSVMTRSRAAMGAMVPDETRRHMRASWRHNLLAVRSMLDHWAQRLDDGSDDDTAAPAATAADKGRENIPID
jgi:hypothetical protein